jgi:hypothetical protein
VACCVSADCRAETFDVISCTKVTIKSASKTFWIPILHGNSDLTLFVATSSLLEHCYWHCVQMQKQWLESAICVPVFWVAPSCILNLLTRTIVWCYLEHFARQQSVW